MLLAAVVYVAGIMEPTSLNVQFVNETDDIVAATNGWEAGRDSADSDDGADATAAAAVSTGYRGGAASFAYDRQPAKARPPPGKKTMGRVKIKMEYIKNKVRRYTTFSKRKTGIMKKVTHRHSYYVHDHNYGTVVATQKWVTLINKSVQIGDNLYKNTDHFIRYILKTNSERSNFAGFGFI